MPTSIENRASRFVATVLTAALLIGAQTAQGSAPAQAQVADALAHAPQTGALYKSDGRALYRSGDGGKRWTEVPLASSDGGGRIAAVAVSAGEHGALYVAGPGLGVLKSLDAGKTWAPVDKGLPSRDVTAFATHSTLPDTLYAVVAAQGIYRSEDRGERWRKVDSGPEARIRRFIHADMEGSMQTGWIFAATDKGVYRAMDCFCGFRLAGNLSGDISAVTYDPKQPKQLYAAAGKQVFSTANGGEEWQPAGSPGAAVSALAYSSSGVLYALLADGRVVQSKDKGQRWQ